jgi:hypothetical protein
MSYRSLEFLDVSLYLDGGRLKKKKKNKKKEIKRKRGLWMDDSWYSFVIFVGLELLTCRGVI